MSYFLFIGGELDGLKIMQAGAPDKYLDYERKDLRVGNWSTYVYTHVSISLAPDDGKPLTYMVEAYCHDAYRKRTGQT